MTKPTKWSVRPAKTQISLGISPVWSELSLSTWRNFGSLATHWAQSKDGSDWADAQADLSLRWVHMPFCWFVMRRLKWIVTAAGHLSLLDIFLICYILNQLRWVPVPLFPWRWKFCCFVALFGPPKIEFWFSYYVPCFPKFSLIPEMFPEL